MKPATIKGVFRAEFRGAQTHCSLFPDPEQGFPSSDPVAISFPWPFVEVMHRCLLQIPLGAKRGYYYNDPAFIRGRLRQIEKDGSNRFELDRIEVLEIREQTKSVPGLRQADSYLSSILWFGEQKQLPNSRTIKEVLHDRSTQPRRVRIRGLLVQNCYRQRWLSSSDTIDQPSPSDLVLPVHGNLDYLLIGLLLLHNLEWCIESQKLEMEHALQGSWATIDGIVRPETASPSGFLIEDISSITIDFPHSHRRVWLKPSEFVWHDQEFE